ncbi:26S proteasome regulatory subunit N10 [Nematocida parisii]|nr:26S proteasome regulatory subunit N10 [Nematocida parisii]KAI5130623.1 26S proteasome regulatory subunit N10 [Nematocida parisii]KAI5144560.1 26S proteasome regulatory subunit N10 [Nematocida parisii]KAI5145907.1 26S proteasome regulatory subunit N10 [Nematocida parisii]KAI5155349.1 26S proteasome regulatory subunit N10 [Nematocida parisii]
MKSDLMVILDNSLYSINKDYTKERLQCQLDVVKNITEQRLNESAESTVGVMTLGRSKTIKIVSPTSNKNTIYSYLHSIQRDEDIHGGNAMLISRMALKYRTNPRQSILLFLGSPIDDDNLMLTIESIEETLSNNIFVGVVLFGEALEHYTLFKSAITESTDFSCIPIEPNQSFMEGVSTALKETVEEIDPELELAIRRSLEDASTPNQ